MVPRILKSKIRIVVSSNPKAPVSHTWVSRNPPLWRIHKRHFGISNVVFSTTNLKDQQTIDEVANEKIMEAENKALEKDVAREEAEDDETPKRIEIGGRDGPEPTRYGDWEKQGRISDF